MSGRLPPTATPSAAMPPTIAAGSSHGAATIYDLGYRHYEGRRLGLPLAFWSLYVESLRGLFGLGRPMRAKAAPFILLALYVAPALLQLALTAFIKQAIGERGPSVNLDLFTFGNYFERWSWVLVLFCIAQAPDLLARDQRYHVLPLFFTRALNRADYPLAKLAALATSLAIVMIVPVVLLVAGRALLVEDLLKGIGDQLGFVPPSLASIAFISAGLAGYSLALSAFSPRRAYSAIGIAVYFLVVELVITIVVEIGRKTSWGWPNTLLLFRPIGAMTDANQLLFGPPELSALGGDSFQPPNPHGPEAYLVAVVAMTVVATAILVWRYRRVEA